MLIESPTWCVKYLTAGCGCPGKYLEWSQPLSWRSGNLKIQPQFTIHDPRSPTRTVKMSSPHRSNSHSIPKPYVPIEPLLLPSDDPDTFLTLMADTLRLSTETLTMAYVYIHRYKRWVSESTSKEPDINISELLDEHVSTPL